MNTRPRRQRAMVEINITPFTDVILVLLVIFMISTPLISQSTIKVNLPNAKSAKTDDSPDKVNIVIDKRGAIYLGEKAVTRNELKDKVELMYKDKPALQVVLISDKLSKFKDIVCVLDVMNEIGIKNLNIASKNNAPGRTR